MPEDKDQKPAAKKAAAPAKKAAPAADKSNPVVTSLNTNGELAVRAARPYLSRDDADRPQTGNDPTSPGNEREHPITSDETVKLTGVKNEVPAELLAKPALAGAPQVENAARTSDRTEGESDRFRKRYVVLAAAYQPDTDGIHARSKVEILNDAINHGLHPRGEAQFDGEEPHPDGVSLYLDYSVAVVPASVDGDANETTTPHHVLVEKYDLSTESTDAQGAEGFDPEK